MCGLVGLSFYEPDPALAPNLEQAIRALAHRGPDGNGCFIGARIALGHTRLSIIDTSSAAAQPMFSHDGAYAIVFNGEIYNYRSLYRRYCPQDGSVNGSSDTAVLLSLLCTYGEDCLPWLDGMFAFSFVNVQSGQCLIARDRFGEKPIYYRLDGRKFGFASELTSLRRLMKGSSWRMCRDGIALFHVIGSIPAPNTIYEDVFALEAGAFLKYSPLAGITTQKYWDIQPAPQRLTSDFDLAREATQTLLMGAVRSRLVSDVPVGLFLSGGYDSSALMACCAALGHPQTLAVCVDFEEQAFSEYPKAATVARHYGAIVHRHVVTKRSFEENLEAFFSAMDQPTGDGYNTFFVCGAARQFGIKAWLSGVGGDELFGGYQSFRRMAKWAAASRILQLLPDSVISAAISSAGLNLRASRFLHMGRTGQARMRAYQACRNPIPSRVAAKLLNIGAEHRPRYYRVIDRPYTSEVEKTDSFQASTMYESSVYMRSQLLRDIDNFSMSHSLELRAPFLESRLFECVYELPERIKTQGNNIKPLLAESVPIPFPEEVLRQKKQGFGFPVDLWLRNELDHWFMQATRELKGLDIWNPVELDRLWQGYKARKVHWSVLWNIFAFAKWTAVHIENG